MTDAPNSSAPTTVGPVLRPNAPVRADFRSFSIVETRWSDNDLYGHVNNSVYYFYFDSVINRYLIRSGGLDIHAAPVIGVTAETMARFRASFAYPDEIEAGLAVSHLSTRSVRYQLGLFAVGEDVARVYGHFIHVFVERAGMRPTQIPAPIRTALERLRITS